MFLIVLSDKNYFLSDFFITLVKILRSKTTKNQKKLRTTI